MICAKCGQEKPLYAKGLCRPCHRYLWYQKNREKELARMHRFREEHRDKLLSYEAFRRKRDQEKRRNYSQCWQRGNLEKDAVRVARREARKRGVADTLTPEQIEFERKIGEAIYPGEKLHLHHLVPLGRGDHSWGNITFIPAWLNESIGDKLPEDVYRQLTLETRDI